MTVWLDMLTTLHDLEHAQVREIDIFATCLSTEYDWLSETFKNCQKISKCKG